MRIYLFITENRGHDNGRATISTHASTVHHMKSLGSEGKTRFDGMINSSIAQAFIQIRMC